VFDKTTKKEFFSVFVNFVSNRVVNCESYHACTSSLGENDTILITLCVTRAFVVLVFH